MALPSEQRPPEKRSRSFDSLSYAKSMESVGFTRQQAEMLAEKQAELIDDRLATKEDIAAIQRDIEALRLSTQSDIKQSELRLEAKIAETKAGLEKSLAETKADIIKWVIGIGFAQVAMILAVLKFHA